MILWPLIERELRSSARRPITHWSRVIGAMALMGILALFSFQDSLAQSMGGKLFGAMHLTLFAAIWIFVPFLAADSISGEIREGTLGLLLLTPVREWHIVLAKGFAHGLRAVALWLAAIPILLLPFLLGGVGWREALLSVCVNCGSICLALGSGLLASSLSRHWPRVILLTSVLSLVCFSGFVLGHALAAISAMGFLKTLLADPPWRHLREVVMFATDAGGFWSMGLGSITPVQRTRWMAGAMATAVIASICLGLMVWLAARRVRRAWKDRPLSRRMRWFLNTFCRPVLFKGLFRRWMQRKLQSDPIGWLERRSWSGRLVTWGWLAVVIVFSSLALVLPETVGEAGEGYHALAWFLSLCLALTAAGTFRRERGAGILELLLVSPMGEQRIISGRVRGLWTEFLPGCAMLIFVWLWVYGWGTGYARAPYRVQPSIGSILAYICSFAAVPIIGMYFSLACRNFPTAFLGTVGFALLGPQALTGILQVIQWWPFSSPSSFTVHFLPTIDSAFWQGVTAALCWYGLYRRLKTRRFPAWRS